MFTVRWGKKGKRTMDCYYCRIFMKNSHHMAVNYRCQQFTTLQKISLWCLLIHVQHLQGSPVSTKEKSESITAHRLTDSWPCVKIRTYSPFLKLHVSKMMIFLTCSLSGIKKRTQAILQRYNDMQLLWSDCMGMVFAHCILRVMRARDR